MSKATLKADGHERGLLPLAASAVLSDLAEYLLYVALPVWVLKQSGSVGAVGLAFILRMLPAFGGPFLGFIVDRYPRRLLLVASSAARTLLVLPLLATIGRGLLGPMYVAILGCALFYLLFGITRRAAVPDLVSGKERLAWANSTLGLAGSLAQVAGASLAALVLPHLAPVYVVGGAAAGYLLSAGSAVLVPLEAGPRRQVGRAVGGPSAGEGTRAFRSLAAALAHPVVLGVVLLIFLEMLAAGPFIAYQIVYLEQDMGLRPEFFGYLFSSQMLGNVVMAAILTRAARRVTPARLLPAAMAGLALSSLVFLSRVPSLVLLSRVLVGFCVTAKVIADDTLIQTFGDRRLLGRTFSLAGMSGAISEVASIALAGRLIPGLGLRPIYLVCAVLQAAGAAGALLIVARAGGTGAAARPATV